MDEDGNRVLVFEKSSYDVKGLALFDTATDIIFVMCRQRVS
jgi:hypothetical protein